MDRTEYRPPSLYFSKSCLINDILQKWKELLSLRVGTIVGNSILNMHISKLAKDIRDFEEKDMELLLDNIVETSQAFLSDRESSELREALQSYLKPAVQLMEAK